MWGPPFFNFFYLWVDLRRQQLRGRTGRPSPLALYSQADVSSGIIEAEGSTVEALLQTLGGTGDCGSGSAGANCGASRLRHLRLEAGHGEGL